MFRVFLALLLCCMLFAQPHLRTIPLTGNEVAGFALDRHSLYLWGEDAFALDLRRGKPQRIADGRFAEGGCLLNGGLILNSVATHELLWLRLSDRKSFVVDTGVDTRDAIAADLLGHHGVLLIQKRQQVRFYDFPAPMRDGWTESELYTIYTPLTEGGLVLADIDGDGLPDLLCGNYWMKSPTRFDLPWREFAIDTWNEEEGSAMLSLAYRKLAPQPVRVAAQRDIEPGRVAWFEPPADPQQLWTPHDLGPLQGASGALFVGKDLIVSERNPPGRVLLYRRTRDGFAPGKELIRTNNSVGMAALPRRRVLLVKKSQVVLLRLANFN